MEGFDLVGLIDSARTIFQDFKSGLFIGLSSLLYLAIQVLRGKAGFSVPIISEKFNSIQSTSVKTWIVLGLFAASGCLTSLTTISFSLQNGLDGLFSGLVLGFGTLGFRTATKTTLESESIAKLKSKMLSAISSKKDDPDDPK
jgi:polyferredoxin